MVNYDLLYIQLFDVNFDVFVELVDVTILACNIIIWSVVLLHTPGIFHVFVSVHGAMPGHMAVPQQMVAHQQGAMPAHMHPNVSQVQAQHAHNASQPLQSAGVGNPAAVNVQHIHQSNSHYPNQHGEYTYILL